jgi:regulator of protease activity HflC (stomatin/prohibitin superfamily)
MKNKRTLLCAAALLIVIMAGCEAAGPEQTSQTPSPSKANQNAVSQNTAGQTAAVVSATEQLPIIATLSMADRIALNAATNSGDASLCDKLSTSDGIKLCQTQVSDLNSSAEAIQKKDASLCEKITDQQLKDACKMQIQVAEQQTQALDDRLQQETQEQQIIKNAGKTGDTGGCAKLTISDLKQDCEYMIKLNVNPETRPSKPPVK